MNFGQALELIRQGKKVYRSSWGGDGEWLGLGIPDLFNSMTRPYIYIEYIDGSRCPWFPSQTELFANDWVVKGEEYA